MDWTKIIIVIVTLIAGLLAGITIKIHKQKNITKTKQSKNVVGGDQAGRDINKSK